MVWRRSARPRRLRVVDLRLGDGNGLDVVSGAERKRPDAARSCLTGYGKHRDAVTAVKIGRGGLSVKARRRRRCGRGVARGSGTEKSELPPQSDVGGPGCAGSTSSASTKCATGNVSENRAAG